MVTTTIGSAGINLDRKMIREIFMKHGFTIKDGQTDLKPYVYAAAEELIEIARRATPQHSGAEQAGERFFMDHGVWHDRVTGQHLWTQDQYDEQWRDMYRAGQEDAANGFNMLTGKPLAIPASTAASEQQTIAWMHPDEIDGLLKASAEGGPARHYGRIYAKQYQSDMVPVCATIPSEAEEPVCIPGWFACLDDDPKIAARAHGAAPALHMNAEGFARQGEVIAQQLPARRRRLVLLRLRTPLANGRNVHVVVGRDDEATEENDRFYYNEHGCPENFLGVEAVAEGADLDPHGLFEHVQSIDAPTDLDNDNDLDIAALFSKFQPSVAQFGGVTSIHNDHIHPNAAGRTVVSSIIKEKFDELLGRDAELRERYIKDMEDTLSKIGELVGVKDDADKLIAAVAVLAQQNAANSKEPK